MGADFQATICDFGHSGGAPVITARPARRKARASRSIAERMFELYLLLVFVGAIAALAVGLADAAAWVSPIISKFVSLVAP